MDDNEALIWEVGSNSKGHKMGLNLFSTIGRKMG
jgi:hypothetical protein